MADNPFIFLAGLHRSGTSLLHDLIRSHPQICGFSGTGVPQDEGQFLQSVYPPGRVFGGPGQFAFDKRASMDDSHPLASPENAAIIATQWRRHLDRPGHYWVEKSPPNLIRTRFLQKLFPGSRFIVILRHPLAVSYATQKWSRTSLSSLLQHTLLAYELFLKDRASLKSVRVLRYEDLVAAPQPVMNQLFHSLALAPIPVTQDIRRNVNEKYFLMWEKERKKAAGSGLEIVPQALEERVNRCGYSMDNVQELRPVPWLGTQTL